MANFVETEGLLCVKVRLICIYAPCELKAKAFDVEVWVK